jgi:broad specificity phosphatase PhoE
MARLWLIRHGRTAWNEDGRIQGRADPALSKTGRAEVQAWRLPQDWLGRHWHASPLRRARETAALVASAPVRLDDRLIEMDWGRFEGRRLADLRAEAPEAMAANEAEGLDFRPPGGESPREVMRRFCRFAADVAADGVPVVAVTHKGVMRAALALATGWDMRTRPPLRLGRDMALQLACHTDGRVELDHPPLHRLAG